MAYLDAYGYVIHLDADAVAQDYAYVVGVGSANDKYGDDADFGATLLLTDATKLKVDLDSDSTDKYDSTQEAREALEGYIVSYSKDSDGLYTLTKRSDNRIDLNENTFNATGLEIKSGTSAMKIFATDDYYANSSTIFLLYDGDDYTVYTGIKNVPDVKGDADTNAVVFDKGGVAKVVYIENANVDGDDEVIFVVGDTGAKAQKDNETNTKYYEYQAMVGGEIVKLKVRDGDAYDFFKTIKTDEIQVLSGLTYNKDGFVTDYDKNFTDWTVKTGIGTEGEDDEVIGIGDAAGKNYATYAYDEDVVVARFDGDDLTKSTIGRIKDDGNDKVTYVLDGKVLMGVCITEVKGTDAPVAYTVKVDNATNVDYTITDENNNSKTNESLVLTEKNLDVTVKMTPKTGYQWADNKGTETRTVTLTKVTEDKTVTADAVEAVAATQATLTLNLDGAYLNINNKAYWDGDTISADFDSVLTATVVPTSASTEENKVMAKPTITGTKNDVSVAGQTLTIVLGENGELTVAYVYDKYDLTGTDSVSNSTYNVENVNGKYQAGADVTLKLTQKTGADLATDAQVTVTINDGAIKATAQVTKAGQTAASAQWDGPKTYASAQELQNAIDGLPEGQTMWNSAKNTQVTSGLVWTSSSDEFYIQTSAEVVEAKGEITVTFTMPNANTEITKIEVQ